MAYKNLLQETLDDLERNHKTSQDVLFVANNDTFCTWNQFEKVAKNYNYDNGFGGVEVDINLTIVGDDWWLERHAYDGSEWWEYKEKPTTYNKTATETIKLKPRYWWYED